MSLIKSISGIRGTIGGHVGEGLSPVDIVKFTAAYATLIKKEYAGGKENIIVVGRDARLSGPMVCDIVTATLCSMGFDVVNIGLASHSYHRNSGDRQPGCRRHNNHCIAQPDAVERA